MQEVVGMREVVGMQEVVGMREVEAALKQMKMKVVVVVAKVVAEKDYVIQEEDGFQE